MKFRKVCAWCRAVMHEGDPDAPTSHGMCEACAARLEAKIDAEEKEQAC